MKTCIAMISSLVAEPLLAWTEVTLPEVEHCGDHRVEWEASRSEVECRLVSRLSFKCNTNLLILLPLKPLGIVALLFCQILLVILAAASRKMVDCLSFDPEQPQLRTFPSAI
jgi:hypothetical protein